MIRRKMAKDIRRDFIGEDFVRRGVFGGDIVKRDTNRTKIVLVLLAKEEMMRRRGGCENERKMEEINTRRRRRGWEGFDGRRKNGRKKVRRSEGWEVFAQMFNIAAGFSPGKGEILKFKRKIQLCCYMWGKVS